MLNVARVNARTAGTACQGILPLVGTRAGDGHHSRVARGSPYIRWKTSIRLGVKSLFLILDLLLETTRD